MDCNYYHQFQESDLILRDYLALDRTKLANERTFLAYIRTALAIIIISGSIYTFFPHELGLIVLSCILLAVAACVFLFAIYRFGTLHRELMKF